MGHAANAQFNACSVARGEADSFAYCDAAYAALTDASAVEFVKQGQNEVARAVPLANLVGHSNEVYGTAVPYMRLKGLVPPSTERAAAPARKPGQ